MKHRIVDSPVGPLTVVVDDDGALTHLLMETQDHRAAEGPGEYDDTVAPEAVAQLVEYFAGERTQFDVPLAPHGTAFQGRVWAALRDIPYGTTDSYGGVAARIGSPRSTRAVGAATGRNPICIIVPCHRVIAWNGVLSHYAGGVARKRFLLDLERGVLPGLALE